MRLKPRRWLASLTMVSALALATPVLAKSEIADIDVGSFTGAYLAGRAAETDRDLDAAIGFYQRALSFEPSNRSIQQSLMLALISKGSFEAALPYADKLKEVPEVEQFSRLTLAIDAMRKSDWQKATFWLKFALPSDLDRLIAGVMSAWAEAGAGRSDVALKSVTELAGPEWYNLFKSYHGALIADLGDNDAEAERLFRQAVENLSAGAAAPDTYLRVTEAFAGFLAGNGRKEEALAVLDQADQFAAGRPTVAALRAQIESGSELEPAVADAKDGAAEVLLNLGSALNRGGGEAFVRLYLQLARALKPDGDLILLQLGSVAEQQQNSEEAIAIYSEIPASSPVKRIAELQLGLNLADLDRHDEAIEHLQALLEQDDDDMRAYLSLGGVYASQENFAAAADIYDKAVARIGEPTQSDWNIFYQRGIAYERLKRWPEAEPNFRKALELLPDQPQVLNYLGYSWVDMNMNLEEGLEMIRRAVELRPRDGYIVDSLGWAYYRLGRFDDAVRELERAVQLKPDDPVLNDHLGDAYWRVGRRLEATFQWTHARDLKPDADVLIGVERKLADGLADEDLPRRAETATPPAPAPEPAPSPSTTQGDRTETVPVEPQRETSSPEGAITAEPARYTVTPGQSLWSIAVDRLGSGERYREILNLNPDLRGDPARLVPGQMLVLPK